MREVAYLFERFPSFGQTFCYREVVELFGQGEKPAKLSGHILTILQKNADGNWVIKRDANFVKPEAGS